MGRVPKPENVGQVLHRFQEQVQLCGIPVQPVKLASASSFITQLHIEQPMRHGSRSNQIVGSHYLLAESIK